MTIKIVGYLRFIILYLSFLYYRDQRRPMGTCGSGRTCVSIFSFSILALVIKVWCP